MQTELKLVVPEENTKQSLFSAIYAENYSLILHIALKITGRLESAEELCQEAFIRYYESGSHVPRNEAKFWLIRVVKNLTYNYEKRKGREKKAYEKLKREPSRTEWSSNEAHLIRDESKTLIQNAMEKLPYKLRIVLILKEYCGFNYAQIAQTLKISESNVKVRVFRAREKLNETLSVGDFYVS